MPPSTLTGYDEWRICADPPGGIPPWQEHEGGGAGGGAGQWHAGSSGGGGQRPARPDAGLLALLRSAGLDHHDTAERLGDLGATVSVRGQ